MELKTLSAELLPHATESSAKLGGASNLRVAIVSDAIAGRNGVGTYYLDLIEYLRPLMSRIELIGPTQQRQPVLERFSLPMPGDPSQRLCFPRGRTLGRRLAAIGPDVIVIPTIGPFSYFAWKHAVKRRIPFVMVHHTNFRQLLSLYWPDAVAGPLGWALARVYTTVMRQATAVAAMNSDAFEQAQGLGAGVVRVMGTPVPSSFITTPVAAIDRQPGRVVFVGRLAAEKGVDQILDAARALPQVRFTIVGDGPLRDRVRHAASAQANVNWSGWLPRESVREQIDRSDILLLPSLLETFGTVALEAMARKRFVLVHRNCGIVTWPSISKGLFFIEQGESATSALRRVLSMPADARLRIAQRSWDATRDFNDYTIRVWMRFLTDTANRVGSEADRD